jgi:hypothetical protein
MVPQLQKGESKWKKLMKNDSFQTSPELLWVERMSKLLDSKFRIPGTSIRFGLDPIFGLFPVAGDLGTMLISLSLIYTMYQNGASGKLVAKMILNVLVDALFGSIPILGSFFDVYYKANNRNVRLLKQYYEDGKHRGSATGVVVSVLLVTVLVLAGLIYGTWLVLDFVFALIF